MKYLVFYLILTSSLASYGQIFSAFDPGFEDLSGQVKWFDIDSDGDLDLLQRGDGRNPDNSLSVKSLIYINDGSGRFTKVEKFFEDNMIILDIKDFDGDGYVDFLVSKSGFDPSRNTSIYKNNFVETGDIELISIINDFGGDGFMIDFDNDGDQDVVFSGQKFIQGRGGGWYFKTAFYKNVGGEFIEMELDDNPFGYFTQDIRPIDFDLDGKLEIVLTGGFEVEVEGRTTNSETRLYTVNGDSFEKSILDTIGIHTGNLYVLDVNNDSYPEIITTGAYWRQMTPSGKRREPITRLFNNQNGSGFSIDMTHSISPTLFGYLAPGDFDNNGFSDIAIIGDTLKDFIDKPFGKVYSNIDGTFSELFDEALPLLAFGSIEWGDFDNDNDLDLAISGAYESTFDNNITIIYKNNGPISNTSPSPPSNLGVQLVDDRFEFTWDASFDNETNSDGLTYNWYLRTETDTIISSNSLASGKRKIVENGNLQYGKTHFLTRFMTPGNYYWSVQAVDNGYQGSPFASEETFHVNFPPTIESVSKANQLEDEPFTIEFDDITVYDPDNTYPDDFSIIVLEGENYNIIDNTITPVKDFFGELTIPLQVKDGLDKSEIFEFTVTVENVNDIPVVVEQLELSTLEELSFTIELDDLIVSDPDNVYPDDFSLIILDGDNYDYAGNTITPVKDFFGELTILLQVKDGLDKSEIFEFTVTVENVNDTLEIIEQATELSTPENTPITINLEDLNVSNPDGSDPDGFELSIIEGDNYTVVDGMIVPDVDYKGTLGVLVVVNNGNESSNIFRVAINVGNVVTSLLRNDNKSISIYPNPFADYLDIDFDGILGDVLIQIIPISGNRMQSIESINIDHAQRINLRHLSDGFYLIKIIQEEKVLQNKKIIKLSNK